MVLKKLKSLLLGNKIANLLGEADDNQSATYNRVILIIINLPFLFHECSKYYDNIINNVYFAIIHPNRKCILFYFITLSITLYPTRVARFYFIRIAYHITHKK